MCGRGGVKGGRARGGIWEFSVEDYEEIVENSNEGNIRTFSVSLGSETRAWERRMQRRRRGRDRDSCYYCCCSWDGRNIVVFAGTSTADMRSSVGSGLLKSL